MQQKAVAAVRDALQQTMRSDYEGTSNGLLFSFFIPFCTTFCLLVLSLVGELFFVIEFFLFHISMQFQLNIVKGTDFLMVLNF